MKTKYTTASKRQAAALIKMAIQAGWERKATTYCTGNILVTYVHLIPSHIPLCCAKISIEFSRWADRRANSQRVDAKIESFYRYEPALRRGLVEAQKAFEHVEADPRRTAKRAEDTTSLPTPTINQTTVYETHN